MNEKTRNQVIWGVLGTLFFLAIPTLMAIDGMKKQAEQSQLDPIRRANDFNETMSRDHSAWDTLKLFTPRNTEQNEEFSKEYQKELNRMNRQAQQSQLDSIRRANDFNEKMSRDHSAWGTLELLTGKPKGTP